MLRRLLPSPTMMMSSSLLSVLPTSIFSTATKKERSASSSSSKKKSGGDGPMRRDVLDIILAARTKKQIEQGKEVSPWMRAKMMEVQRRRREPVIKVADVTETNSTFGVVDNENGDSSSGVQLSTEQQAVVDSVLQGRNVFITGGAGSGKTHCMRSVIEAMPKATTRVAAPTGVAAMNVGGLTLHSLFSIYPGDEHDLVRIETKLQRASPQYAHGLRALIIDEISMVSPALFEAVQLCCKRLGPRRDLPWGGVQVVLCGDFLQLPPVPSKADKEADAKAALLSQMARKNSNVNEVDIEQLDAATADARSRPRYCFQTQAWTDGMFQRMDLTGSFRQKSDPEFVDFLNATRVGNVKFDFLRRRLAARKTDEEATAAATTSTTKTGAKKKAIKKKGSKTNKKTSEQEEANNGSNNNSSTPLDPDRPVVQIRATNFEVDNINKLAYEAVRQQNLELEKRILAENPNAFDVDNGNSKSNKYSFTRPSFSTTFLPVTTGACDAQTLRDSSIPSQLELQRGTRVVLLRNLDVKKGLVNGRIGTVTGFARPPIRLLQHSKNLRLEEIARDGVLPIVDFDQERSGPCMILPFMWSVGAGDKVVGTVTQLPLRHAWAVTSHRSQGLTIDRVEVCLKRFFEHGQAYVALSRSRSADGLRVLSTERAHWAIKACPIALKFQCSNNDNDGERNEAGENMDDDNGETNL